MTEKLVSVLAQEPVDHRVVGPTVLETPVLAIATSQDTYQLLCHKPQPPWFCTRPSGLHGTTRARWSQRPGFLRVGIRRSGLMRALAL